MTDLITCTITANTYQFTAEGEAARRVLGGSVAPKAPAPSFHSFTAGQVADGRTVLNRVYAAHDLHDVALVVRRVEA
jgi:hypothetical protein